MIIFIMIQPMELGVFVFQLWKTIETIEVVVKAAPTATVAITDMNLFMESKRLPYTVGT
jgi:hypothetical protein